MSSVQELPVGEHLWCPGHFRLFISHVAEEKKKAFDIKLAFLRYGVSAFVAHDDIAPRKDWQIEVESALKSADALIALVTPTFHQSDWTDQEIGFALGREIPVLTVKLGAAPKGFVGRFQAISAPKDFDPKLIARRAHAVLATLDSQTRYRIASCAVTVFEESGTFESAKRNIALLEGLGQLPRALKSRIEAAAAGNSQIKDAFGVPDRVNGLQYV
jgi:hypothetical protein